MIATMSFIQSTSRLESLHDLVVQDRGEPRLTLLRSSFALETYIDDTDTTAERPATSEALAPTARWCVCGYLHYQRFPVSRSAFLARFNQRGLTINASPLNLMLLLLPLSLDAGGVSEPRPTLSLLREKRSRGRLYLLFQTHGLHLKKIDGLGLRVLESRGGQATTEHQRGVDVDAIGLHVRHALC